MQFNIEIQLEKGYLTIRAPYKINPNPYFMIQYNKEAIGAIYKYQEQLIALNIKHYRYYTITQNEILRAQSINEMIRIYDVVAMENSYYKRKLKVKQN